MYSSSYYKSSASSLNSLANAGVWVIISLVLKLLRKILNISNFNLLLILKQEE